MRRVALDHIKEGEYLAKSIYLKGRILLMEGQKLEPRFIKRLKELGFSSVYVREKGEEEVEVEDIVSDQIKQELEMTFRKSLQEMKTKKGTFSIEHLMDLLDEAVEEIARQKKLAVAFMDIKSAEDYMYAHAVNTCLLSLAVGSKLIYDRKRLKSLAVGALLHDVGLAHLPENIVGKKGRLIEAERKIIQSHAEIGYQLLKANRELSLLSAHVAYQHHERYDGKGYPRGLEKEQIHIFARITAVCSVYDALTSDRPYRKRFLPDHAFSLLLAENEKAFDPLVLKAFIDTVALYPIGTQVQLNNGMRGVVVSVTRGATHRPTVRITHDEKGRKLDSPFEVSLLEEKTLLVQKVLE